MGWVLDSTFVLVFEHILLVEGILVPDAFPPMEDMDIALTIYCNACYLPEWEGLWGPVLNGWTFVFSALKIFALVSQYFYPITEISHI